MRERITRAVAVFVMSVLLVALAAGAALAADIVCVPGATTCSGTTQDDYITGTAGVDNISASFGNDQVYVEAGNDYVRGSHGRDHLVGDAELTPGNDRIYGNSGDDVLSDENGSDYLNGGDDDDTIYALRALGETYEGKDTILGGIGEDTIYAADGVVDSIDCGEDQDGWDEDEVTYDRGIDVVAANCEVKLPR